MTRRIWVAAIAMLTTLNSVSGITFCASKSRAENEEASTIQPPPAPWETKIDALYVSRGVSKIEKIETRYVLTTYCAGTHSVYAEGGEGVMLDKYLGEFIRARYVYITAPNPQIRCVQAPCDPAAERVAVIKSVEPMTISEAERLRLQRLCTTDGMVP